MRDISRQSNGHSWTGTCALTAICCGAKVLAEEWQHMVLESISNCADMRAGIDFKCIRDPIVIEDGVEFACVDAQAILITDVHRDGAIQLAPARSRR